MGRAVASAATAVALVVGVSLAAPPVAMAGPAYPTPDPDPFYSDPADLDSKANGDVIRSRQVGASLYGAKEIWQIAYRSENSSGHPITAVTNLLIPEGGPAIKPLLSYQTLVNSLGLSCAPSHTMFNGTMQEAPLVWGALQSGWAVAVPDYLGPTSAYGAAKLGGRLVLDGVRAIQRLSHLGLAESPVALAGYSGGGMSTAFAAAMAPTYAPELNIVGVAEGGIPADMNEMADGLGFNPHPAFGLAFAAAIGLEREYPQVPMSDQLNAYGIGLRDVMHDLCRSLLIAAGVGRSATMVAKTTSLASDPAARAVLRENSVTFDEGVPKAPLLVWHGANDPLTPIRSVTAMVHRYCAAGATVQYNVGGIEEHLTTAVVGLPVVHEFLSARFRGDPAPSNC